MKKIALFGATGKSGRPFLKLALERGYEIRALVRNPQKLSQEAQHLNVLQGDILNEADVRKTIEGADVVVNLTGHVKGSPPDLQTQCIRHMMLAMKSGGKKRIITLTGSGVTDRDHDGFSLVDRIVSFGMQNLAGRAIRQRFRDGLNYAGLLIEEKDLDWTIVRPAAFTNGKRTGQYRHGFPATDKTTRLRISRADVADFMLKQLMDETYLHKTPGLSY